MKHYDPPSDHNDGMTLHGLVYPVKPVTSWGNYRALGWMDYMTPWWDASLFQELIYADENIRNTLAKLAASEWSQAGHAQLRRDILLLFTTKYKKAAGIIGDSPEEAFFVDCRQHLIEHAQVVADWCMYEYSRYPYEWGVVPPPEDISKYIPIDLWAKDISRVAARISRGDEIDVDRVRKNEYDYSPQVGPVVVPKPTTGKKKVIDPRTWMKPEQLAKLEAEEKAKQAKLEAERVQVEELAAIDKKLERRLKFIEKHATELTLAQSDDKPSDDVVLEVTQTVSELQGKLSRQLQKIEAAALRRKEMETPEGEYQPR